MRRRGFTLIELTFVTATLTVLTLLAITAVSPHYPKAASALSARDRDVTESAVAMYRFDHRGQAPSSEKQLYGQYMLERSN